MMKRKKRSENWTTEEKEILRQFIADSVHITECKSNTTIINNQKSQEWRKIMKKFNGVTGKNRSDREIKLAWKRMKLAAKPKLSIHDSKDFIIKSDERSLSSSPEDLAVIDVAPHDFINNINKIYSDTVQSQTPDISHNNCENEKSDTDESLEIILESQISKPDTSEVIRNDTPVRKSTPKHKKKMSLNMYRLQESITASNLNFKKRQLQMLEEVHNLNIKISKLKIEKLQLEIDILKRNTVEN